MKRAVALAAALLAAVSTASSAQTDCSAITVDSERLACYDAQTRKPAPAPIAESAPAPVEKAPEQNFGAESLPKPAAEQEPDEIHARVRGAFAGWKPGLRLELDNGQVWKVTGGESMSYGISRDTPVTIERGAFGTYYLRVDGYNRRVRVQRLQ